MNFGRPKKFVHRITVSGDRSADEKLHGIATENKVTVSCLVRHAASELIEHNDKNPVKIDV